MKEQSTSVSLEKEKVVSSTFWYTIAFLEGALVIFSELIGSKLMGSFYGASLAVWTAVISVTITFLSLGYYVGGKLSKNLSKSKILSQCFALAALFVVIMPFWSTTLFLKFNEASLVSDAIKTAILLVGPSVFCLGISSPIIIQILSEQEGQVGKVAGRVYAISTLAGILSTLLLGYVLLPSFGLQLPLVISGVVLVLVALFLKRNMPTILLSLVVLFVSIFSLTKEKEDIKYHKTLYESEGLMGQLKVIDQDFSGNDLHYRLLFINGIPQTIIHNKDKSANSFWEYVHRISATASLKKGKKALLIGMGGGAIANELQKLGIELDVVDIDQRMFEVSQQYFYFAKKKSTSFYVDDARHYIKTCTKKYDLVVIDICIGEVQPSNLFTMEGLAELQKIVKKDALILMQYQEKLDKRKTSGSQSIARTFLESKYKVWQHVEKLEVSGVILAASPQNIDFSAIDTSAITKNVKQQLWLPDFLKQTFQTITKPASNSILLVDDQPILEKINAETIEAWRKSILKFYGLKFLGQEIGNQ